MSAPTFSRAKHPSSSSAAREHERLSLELYFIGPGGGSASVKAAPPAFPPAGLQVKALLGERVAFSLLVDPGPAIYGNVPARVENLFVSHVHTDHFGGARVAIEAMEGHGLLFAPKPVMKALAAPEGYHLRKFQKEKRIVLDTGLSWEGNGPLRWSLAAVEAQHYDEAYGFLLTLTAQSEAYAEAFSLYYTSDTGNVSLAAMEKADIVVANVPFVDRENEEYHLTYAKVVEAVAQLERKPRAIAFSHVGSVIIEALAENRERWERIKAFLQELEAMGVVAFIPQRGTRLAVGEGIRVEREVPHSEPWEALARRYGPSLAALRRRVELF